MPLTFEEPSGRRQSVGRRPSASSPYPGRVMVSLKPAAYPSPSFRVRSGSSASTGSQRRVSDAKDPFIDTGAGTDADADADDQDDICEASRASEHPTCSPQEECMPSRWSDPERQPLLAGNDAEQRNARSPVAWTLALAFALALVVAAIIVLGIVRMANEQKVGDS